MANQATIQNNRVAETVALALHDTGSTDGGGNKLYVGKSILVDQYGNPLNTDKSVVDFPDPVIVTGTLSATGVLCGWDWKNFNSAEIEISGNGSNFTIVMENTIGEVTWEQARVKREAKPEQGLIASMQTTGLFTAKRKGLKGELRISNYSSGSVVAKVVLSKKEVDPVKYLPPPLVAYQASAAAATSAKQVKTSGGTLLSAACSNSSASGRWLKIFDRTSITAGTTAADFQFYLPPGWNGDPLPDGGIECVNGIYALITAAKGLSDNTTTGLVADEVLITYGYA